MTAKRLRDEWANYRERVVPVDAPPVQVQESRRAFYAGAQAFYGLSMEMLTDESEPTDGEVAAYEKLIEELEFFCSEVEAGRA